jgi:hypothetical protein
MSGNIDSMVA